MKKIISLILSAAMSTALLTSVSAAPSSAPTIDLSGAEHGTYYVDFAKYGGDTKVTIPIKTNGAGTIRLVDKDIVEGKDVIRSVKLSGDKITLEAKFPADMEEPEDYTVEVTLRAAGAREDTTCHIAGTVFLQDSDGPVAPDQYREKKFVVVDFNENNDDEIQFKGGYLDTTGLQSGVANLDISYTTGSYEKEVDRLTEHCVNFTASPKLDRSVTVHLDADANNLVYEIKNGKPVKMDTKYSATDRTLSFKTSHLGEYVLTSSVLAGTATPNQNTASSDSAASSAPAVTVTNSDVPAVKGNPSTGASPLDPLAQ